MPAIGGCGAWRLSCGWYAEGGRAEYELSMPARGGCGAWRESGGAERKVRDRAARAHDGRVHDERGIEDGHVDVEGGCGGA